MILPLAITLMVIGIFIPSGVLTNEIAQLVVTFFGLMAAAVLPALSLLVGNTLSSGLSIKQLEDLKAKVDTLISRLLVVLGVLVVGTMAVIIYRIGLPTLPLTMFPDEVWASLPSWLPELPERLAQSIVLTCFGICVDRLRLIASAFKRVLNARHTLAVSDSRKRLDRVAPGKTKIRTSFKTPENFGERVKVGVKFEEDTQG